LYSCRAKKLIGTEVTYNNGDFLIPAKHRRSALNDLTDRQREKLVQHVSKAVADIHPTDVVLLLPLIMQNASIQQAVLNTVMSFVTNELRMQIVD